MRSQIFKISFLLLSFAIFSDCNRSLSDQPIATCQDGLQNGDETGVDCGGACPPCLLELEIPASGYETPESYEEYSLVWSDEFGNNELDQSKWSFHLGDGCPNLCGWGNNELQFYTDNAENIFIQDGFLVIRALKEQTNGYNYSSSRIHTDNKFEFQYGRVDIRAAMPSPFGTWAALWLLNKDYSIYNPGALWPSGGEIDIMEYLGEDPDDVMGTAHFGTDFPANHRYISKHFQASDMNFDEQFYVFSLIWEEDKIQWLVNDNIYHEITPTETSAHGQPYPFNDEYFLLMNLSVGGNLPQAPIASQYPGELIIDYVRVFQK